MQIVNREDSIILRRSERGDVVLSIDEALRLTESGDLRQAIHAAKAFGAEARARRISELEADLLKLRSIR
jgi:hypothetical protein